MATTNTDVKLQPHQQRVIDKLQAIENPYGLIAYHSLGSGKTLTALSAFDKLLTDPKKKGLFVVPASLVENVNKEIDKHKLHPLKRKLDVISYERAANHYQDLLKRDYGLVAFDEAHRLRNRGTKRVQNLQHLIQKADKTLMLTGTAGYNHPADMAVLINLLNPDLKMPETHADFEKAYIDNNTWKLKNKEHLSKLLNNYIDRYQTPIDSGDFPTVSRTVIPVEMSPRQASLYRLVERDIPSQIRSKLRDNLPMSLKDTSTLNVFSQGVRQVSDTGCHHDMSFKPSDSPKLMEAVNRMAEAAKAPGFRGVLYSNYIDAGINPYVKELQARKIKPLVFTGSLNQAQKKELIDAYNSNSKQPKVLILSSSGAEGIDLKNTKLIQLLEPHFNKSKLKQAEGRAIRYKSHESLPLKDRHVSVEEYRSTLPRTFWQRMFNRPASTAIDDYLASASDRKQAILDDIDNLIQS